MLNLRQQYQISVNIVEQEKIKMLSIVIVAVQNCNKRYYNQLKQTTMGRMKKKEIIYKRLREKKTLSKIRQGESLRKLEVRIGLGLK
jgi:hypothetical protein